MDVQTEIIIDRPLPDVAAFAADPSNAPKWYANIRSAQWKTKPPLAVGSRVSFVAQFLGKRLAYTYEFTEVVPGKRVVMRTVEGPFGMETTYTWETVGPGRTRMTLRNRGQPTGFSRLAAPFMRFAVRRESRQDLARLKVLLERGET